MSVEISLFQVDDKNWWKWFFRGIFCNPYVSISISKKLLSKSRPKEFAYVSHFQWAVFIIFLLLDNFDLHQLSTFTKLIGMALWFVYIFLVIRLRYRFNQKKLEDHCHLMALLYTCCCPCSYGQMGAELLEKKSAIITV
ncbi:Oidioi.mRNA.OKI2018_I69.PAR.g9639.t1.cds [Oikopleura dioica]|uniref:Oidioi.mRNA.OKI2018_I69.PAR.g9639.t1.cds n=1 Tax=Oikopleura dioica TaxID=34765 RepID=A0ABN7RRX3_OIKDI|nr:Oidioi.mRNA.OKI2018_I69.PAR.g9639.t1.cds [Oikopleura dioica]